MTRKQIGTTMRAKRGNRSLRHVAVESGLQRRQIKGIEQGSMNYTINSLLALCDTVGAQLKIMALDEADVIDRLYGALEAIVRDPMNQSAIGNAVNELTKAHKYTLKP